MTKAMPKHIWKYDIIRLIAQSNDSVYEAWDASLARRIALKVLEVPVGAASDQVQDRIERFEREARAAGRLNHPNIATVYEVGESNGLRFIAMEFVEAPTLQQVLKQQGVMKSTDIVKVMSSMLDALGAAHKAGIIHRDVKPANIFMLEDYSVKVADFGIAKIQHEPTMTIAGQIWGTPHYMSPEQATGKDVGPATDIWAVGVIGYELATGIKPFEGGSSIEILQKIAKASPDWSLVKNTALRGVLREFMAKDAVARPGTAEDAKGLFHKARASAQSKNAPPAKSPQRSVPVNRPPRQSQIILQRPAVAQPSAQAQPVRASPATRNTHLGRRWFWSVAAILGTGLVAYNLVPQGQPESDNETPMPTKSDERDAVEADRPAARPPEGEKLAEAEPTPGVHEHESASPGQATERTKKSTTEIGPDDAKAQAEQTADLTGRKRGISPSGSESHFTVGSTIQDVRRIMGTPRKVIDIVDRQIQYFGKSSVTLDSGKVVAFDNEGELHVTMGDAQIDAQAFNLGDSKTVLIKAMGTPTKIVDILEREIWYYERSSVTLDHGRIVAFDNEGNLRVDMGVASSNPSSFTIGSDRKTVLRAMGTPNRVVDIMDRELLYYGHSSVTLDNGKVVSYDNEGNLNVE